VSRLMVVALMLLATGLVSLRPPPVSLARNGVGSERLDLAALLLRPADLAAVGIDGYGTGVSATGSGETIARFDERYRGGSGTVPLLGTGNVARGSSLYLVRNDDLDLPSPDRVLSSIDRFDDATDAGAAYDALVEGRSAIAAQVRPVVIADAGRATGFLVTGSDPLGAATYRQASVVGVVDDLVIEVAVELTSEMPLDDGLAADLFSVEVDRIASAPSDGAGLGNRTLEIAGSNVVPELGRYITLEGESIPESGQSSTLARGQGQTFAAFDVEDAFQASYRSADGALSIGSYVSSHASDAAARSYFQAIPDLLGTTDGYRDVRIDNAIVPVGTSATLLTYSVDGLEGTVVTELIFRTGSLVVELIVNAPRVVSKSDMTTLGRASEVCLDGPDCPPGAVPSDLASSSAHSATGDGAVGIDMLSGAG